MTDNPNEISVLYGDDQDEDGCMAFGRRCKCDRFLKMPDNIEYKRNWATEEIIVTSKADCKKCGSVDLNDYFEGFYSDEEL
jgi:hypothetical protein